MGKAAQPRLKYPDTRLAQMSQAQLADALGQIVDLWFLDTEPATGGESRDFYNLDKELDADHLEHLTRILNEAGLAPPQRKERT